MADLYQQALQMFPRLTPDLAYRENFGKDARWKLEFYPKGETDSFDPSKPAVEVFDQTMRPEDVAAEIVSHHMVNQDPVVSNAYNRFITSFAPWQHMILQKQYAHAQKNEGEDRSFNDWAMTTGYPAYFRGYAFGQWPSDATNKMYTPEQKSTLNAVIQYLRGK